MAIAITANSTLTCTMGTTPSNLVVTPSKIKIGGIPVADIQCSTPNKNIPPFGMCRSPSNPQVAKMMPVPPPGVIKPQPCMPNIPGSPWTGCVSKVKWAGQMPLTSDGCLQCSYGGTIKVIPSGRVKI